MKLKDFIFEVNEKYARIYNKALCKVAPQRDNTDDSSGVYCVDSDGNYATATPMGYDKEQLEWDALHDVIVRAFVEDKDYVCWSNGGHMPIDGNNPFETKEGETLKKYDPVLLLDNFGFPKGFVMFTGEYETIEEYGGVYVKPHFIYMYNGEEIRDFKPKVYVGLTDEEKNSSTKTYKKSEMVSNPNC